jgi:hypothetical protein
MLLLLLCQMPGCTQAARNGLVTVQQGGVYVDAGTIGVNAGLITSNSILTVVGDATVLGPSAVGVPGKIGFLDGACHAGERCCPCPCVL